MGSGNSKGAGGFRVFRVVTGGPADQAGLELFFDYVVEVNGVVVESDKQSLALMIKDQEGKRVKLTVYNCRTQALRDVFVIPRSWDGQGLLGLVVKFDLVENGENQGLRVLEVQSNSPAMNAGLKPFKDFLIASGDILIRDGNDLSELVNSHIGEDLPLTVYNTDTESIREVRVIPQRGWGGEGLLGFATGTGVLHRIPMARTSVRVSENSTGDLAPAEPVPSLEATDPTSPTEPCPTPPVPELVPIEAALRPSASPTRNVSILNLQSPNSPASSSSPKQVEVRLPPLVQPAYVITPQVPNTVEQHNIATPMSLAEQCDAPADDSYEGSQTVTSVEESSLPPLLSSEEISAVPVPKNSAEEMSLEEFSIKEPMNSVAESVSETNRSSDHPEPMNSAADTGLESEIQEPVNSAAESHQYPSGLSTKETSDSPSEISIPIEWPAHASSAPESVSEEIQAPLNSAQESLTVGNVTSTNGRSGEQSVAALFTASVSVTDDFEVPQNSDTVGSSSNSEERPVAGNLSSPTSIKHNVVEALDPSVSSPKPAPETNSREVADLFGDSNVHVNDAFGLHTVGQNSESEYSQSVAEAFGLVPPVNSEEDMSARRSSDGSAVIVDRLSPDISKLFD